MYSLANTLVFWLLTPVSVGVGSEIGQICGVFSSKDSKMHIFLTFLNGYIHPNNFKNKNKLWGFAPNPTLTCRGRRGRWQTLSTYPYGECWVDSKASRVKCTTSSPLTLSISVGVAKLTEADRAETCQGLRSNRVAAWPLQVGGDPTLCGKGAGGFSCTPATWRTRVWAAPTVLARPLGVAQ